MKSEILENVNKVSSYFFDKLEALKEKYKNAAVVAYINTTAELKTLCDVCVTSASALDVVKRDGNLFTFEGTHCIPTSGSFKIAYRMYPKNADLPHRQDFCYVKWFN